MRYSRSIKHSRRVGTAVVVSEPLGNAGAPAQVMEAPQSGGGRSGMAAPAWPGWARTLQSHSGGRARSFSWKGSRRRHSPRACSSMAGSSTALPAGPSGPGLLLAARPHTAMTLRAPKATSSTRPTTSAAPASMSACRRKVLIPARERPWPHPGACCPRDPSVLTVPHNSSRSSALSPCRNPHSCLQARACLPNIHPMEMLRPRARRAQRWCTEEQTEQSHCQTHVQLYTD